MTEAASPSSKISFYLYATQFKTDYGVYALGSECVTKTKEVLEARYGKGNVTLLPDNSYLAKMEKGRVFVIPGGTFHAQAMDFSKYLPVVKEYVEAGNGALGICAGGMSVSKSLISKKTGQKDIPIEGLSFNLLPVGVSVPSEVDPLRKSSIPNDSGEEVFIKDRENIGFRAYRNKGGDIQILEEDAGVQWESFYLRFPGPYPNAAVSGPCGKGRVVNIQYHPEFDPAEELAPKSKDDLKEDSKAGCKSSDKAEPSKDRANSLKSFYRIVDTNFLKA